MKLTSEQSSEDCGRWCGQFYVVDQLNKRKPSFKQLRNSSANLSMLKACKRDILVSCFCTFLSWQGKVRKHVLCIISPWSLSETTTKIKTIFANGLMASLWFGGHEKLWKNSLVVQLHEWCVFTCRNCPMPRLQQYKPSACLVLIHESVDAK